MKKIILKIIIGLIIFLPSISEAKYVVTTQEATGITDNSVFLHGTKSVQFSLTEENSNSSSSPFLTAYFRYTTASYNKPLFCNDIYGSNMRASGDIPLSLPTGNPLFSQPESFSIQVNNLKPDTTYYYCAIVSNRNEITYGGEEIVRSFTTLPCQICDQTSVQTTDSLVVNGNTVYLKGNYNSTKDVKTYFKYQEVKEVQERTTDNLYSSWIKVNEENHLVGSKSSVSGNLNFKLTGLKPNTSYKFIAMAETTEDVFNGSTLSFKTKTSNSGGTIVIGPDPIDNQDVIDESDASYCDLYPTSIPCTTAITCEPANYYYDSITGKCTEPISCASPEIYYWPTNSCVIPPTCVEPEIYNPSTNSCITPPNPAFCEENPNDEACLPGPGWIWDGDEWIGGGWNDGIWDGGGWIDGQWIGGSWTSGDWTGGGWSNGQWVGNLFDSGYGWNSAEWDGTNLGNNTWSGGSWQDGSWIGGNWTKNLKLGQKATPPNDAIVRLHEGVEHVFVRQIMKNNTLATAYGYKEGTSLESFANDLAHLLAKSFGYIDANGKEIRVVPPDRAAYELQFSNGKLTIYEYFDGKIVGIRTMSKILKSAYDYEYYYKK